MSKLSAFLHPAVAHQTKEIIVSKRFVDEAGNVVPFKIRALTQGENDAITKKSTRKVKENGQIMERLDSIELSRRIVVAATVEPDFSSKEMCDAYETLNPLEVPGKMLLSGEYKKLIREISDLSGFDDDLEEQVKN